jgi:hypothetical protein
MAGKRRPLQRLRGPAALAFIPVLPFRQVARDPVAIVPGQTQVLILEERNDPKFIDYVARDRVRPERVLEGRNPDRD